MIKINLLRYAAIGMASVSMAGFAAAGSYGFNTTGPDSHNRINVRDRSTIDLNSRQTVTNRTTNDQKARSGDVTAYRNTEVGGHGKKYSDCKYDKDHRNACGGHYDKHYGGGYGSGGVGDLTSGPARNSSVNETSIDVTRPDHANLVWAAKDSGGYGGLTDWSLHKTGPDSHNRIDVDKQRRLNVRDTTVVNNTYNNRQDARSGDVTAFRNTSVGDLTSGPATNTSSNYTDISVGN